MGTGRHRCRQHATPQAMSQVQACIVCFRVSPFFPFSPTSLPPSCPSLSLHAPPPALRASPARFGAGPWPNVQGVKGALTRSGTACSAGHFARCGGVAGIARRKLPRAGAPPSPRPQRAARRRRPGAWAQPHLDGLPLAAVEAVGPERLERRPRRPAAPGPVPCGLCHGRDGLGVGSTHWSTPRPVVARGPVAL